LLEALEVEEPLKYLIEILRLKQKRRNCEILAYRDSSQRRRGDERTKAAPQGKNLCFGYDDEMKLKSIKSVYSEEQIREYLNRIQFPGFQHDKVRKGKRKATKRNQNFRRIKIPRKPSNHPIPLPLCSDTIT